MYIPTTQGHYYFEQGPKNGGKKGVDQENNMDQWNGDEPEIEADRQELAEERYWAAADEDYDE